MPSNTSNGSCVFTTSYSYGSDDKEYVFFCKGRPFVALVSPNLPTPTSSLVDYDLVRKLGITMTDIQCRKFYFGGHKMRILGRVSTAVQTVQNGRINGNFHIKGLVISDLYQMLETHCVAGARMQERLAHLAAHAEADSAEESDEEPLNTSLEDADSPSYTTITKSSPSYTTMPMSSSSTTTMPMSSSSTTAMSMSSSSTTAMSMSSSSTTAMSMSSSSTTAMPKSSPTRTVAKKSSPSSPPARPSSPTLTLSPTTKQSHRIQAVRHAYYREIKKDSLEIVNNERSWARLKKQDPEYAWAHLKCAAGCRGWPDWDSSDHDLREPSLEDEPDDFFRKYVAILEQTDPDCLCLCGFPHLDYKCTDPEHDKKKKHCKDCCDDPKYLRFLV